MIKNFCEWYLNRNYEEEVKIGVNKGVEEEIKKLLDFESEEFNLGDEVFFYYFRTGAPCYTHGTYHKAKINDIKVHNFGKQSEYKQYFLDVLTGRFVCDFSVSGDSKISKSKLTLRNKMLSMDTTYPITNESYNKVNLDD